MQSIDSLLQRRLDMGIRYINNADITQNVAIMGSLLSQVVIFTIQIREAGEI